MTILESSHREDAYKAHGLSGKLEQPDWPPLELTEVDALLRSYPQAGGATAILSHSPRPFSSAGLVSTPRGNVFVKRHSGAIRSREGLLEEHRLIAHLAQAFQAELNEAAVGHTLSVPLVLPVLPNNAGETAISVSEWTYEVHPVAHGVDAYEQVISWEPFLRTGHAHAAGRALAQLHQAAQGYTTPARKAHQLVTSFTLFAGPESFAGGADVAGTSPQPSRSDELDALAIERMHAYLHARPRLQRYAAERDWEGSFRTLLLPWYRDLAPWLHTLKPLWTHNDFHASNLMWSGNGNNAEVTGIIDFGLADRTNAIHDLATAVERNIVEWLRMDDPAAQIVHFDHLEMLLAGYEEVLPLSYEQARALAAMMPLVHCEFALSETDYFLTILHSEEKAYLAYEGYFLAHAEWFHSPQGDALLECLRAWAERHRGDARRGC